MISISAENIKQIASECFDHWMDYHKDFGDKRVAYVIVLEDVFTAILVQWGVPEKRIDPFTFALDVYRVLNESKQRNEGKEQLITRTATFLKQEIDSYITKYTDEGQQKQQYTAA